ncbi:kyphoscoliosis peptidase-like [Haliotis asinina]|uniref:kyphoscoliosis peptidase-like n=1 Tax=Haliotis asinina TaxID=109174 RepID=UPI00353192FE
MGQSSSKANKGNKKRKDRQILRVPSNSGSFGRGYRFISDEGVLTVPPTNGMVINKFYSMPRVRTRSRSRSPGRSRASDESARGIMVFSASEKGTPVNVGVIRKNRPSVMHTFDGTSTDVYVRQSSNHHSETHTQSSGPIMNRHTTNQKVVAVSTNQKSSVSISKKQGVPNGTERRSRERQRFPPSTSTEPQLERPRSPVKHSNNKTAMTINQAPIIVTSQKLVTTPLKISNPPGKVTRSKGVGVRRNSIPESRASGPTFLPQKPALVPPVTRKKDIITNAAMFEETDRHALQCPEASCSSLRSLATYLTCKAPDDLHRVRAIYRWITHNIGYDINSILSGTYKNMPCDTQTILLTRKAVCHGFANIFTGLCREVDIVARAVPGFSKDFFYDPDRPLLTFDDVNHTWNIVFVHGEWRQIDCTYGSGYIDDDNRFCPMFNDFYFLMDPQKFVWSHYPYIRGGLEASYQYQLLNPPLNIHLFNKKVSPTLAALQWGLELLTHKDCVIHVDKSVKIEFRVNRAMLVNVLCKFKNTDTGEACDRYVVPRRKKDGSFSITVYPPARATYKLQVFGESSGGEYRSCPLISYSIKCMSFIAGMKPFPENNGLWGVKAVAENYGFVNDVYKDDFFVTDNGILEFSLGMANNATTLLKMEHAVQDNPDLNNFVTSEYSYSGMRVRARFPWVGYYKISLFAKPPGTDGNTVDLIAVYLVQCKTALKDCQPFPTSFPFTQACMATLVEPQNGVIPAGQTVNFLVDSVKMARILVDGRGSSPVSPGVFQGQIQPKPAGVFVSLYGNMDGSMDYDELFRFSVIETREGIAV